LALSGFLTVMDAGQEGESRRRLEAAYVDRQSSGSVDARRFAGKTIINSSSPAALSPLLHSGYGSLNHFARFGVHF
jgi:hypothetical protein